MEEYNLLTQKLLAEGYTVENHPDYVYIRNSYSETQDPLQNFDGGFRYYEWYIYDHGRAGRSLCPDPRFDYG